MYEDTDDETDLFIDFVCTGRSAEYETGSSREGAMMLECEGNKRSEKS